jgi:hypothetical protein
MIGWVIRPCHRDSGIDYVVELFNYVDEKQWMAEALGEQLFPDFAHTLGTLILEKSESGTAHG